MSTFNLVLIILILFILFNKNFDNEIENIKEQKNNKKNNSNNYQPESFSGHEEMNLTVEKESSSIGSEIKKAIVNTFIISQERIKKSVGKFDIIGNKKMIRGAFSVQPPDEFQMMEMGNKELEKKIKNAAKRNQIKIQTDGKITKTQIVSKIKNKVLFVNLILHIS